MPHHQRGVTHHVVEDAAALELSLPEPGHVGSAVLLRRPGQIGAARERGAARPDDGAALRHGRCERLVFEIAVGDPGLFRELEDPLRFRDVAAEWFLTRDPAELSLPARDGVRDLLEVVDAGEVRTAHPERIDRGRRSPIARWQRWWPTPRSIRTPRAHRSRGRPPSLPTSDRASPPPRRASGRRTPYPGRACGSGSTRPARPRPARSGTRGDESVH